MSEKEIAKLVFDEARRAIVEQQSVLDNLHNRAGLLLSAAALSTAFFAGDLFKSDQLDLFPVLITICFVLVLFLSLRILWPRREAWRFQLNTERVARDFLGQEPRSKPTVVYRKLAKEFRKMKAKNKKELDRMFRLLQLGAAALGLEVLMWLVHLWRVSL